MGILHADSATRDGSKTNDCAPTVSGAPQASVDLDQVITYHELARRQWTALARQENDDRHLHLELGNDAIE